MSSLESPVTDGAARPLAIAPQGLAPLRLAMTGYVSAAAGSIAGSGGLLLRELVRRGSRVTFHSKPWFVDPRPLVANEPNGEHLRLIDCSNGLPDALHRASRSGPLRMLRPLAGVWDDRTYRRRVAASIAAEARGDSPPEAALWMGTPAARRIVGLPTVSWTQGAAGSDARSIERHADDIRRLGGRLLLAKLRAYAAWRLGPGRPRYEASDRLVVGSQASRAVLVRAYGVASDRVHALPYALDLTAFIPPETPRPTAGPLRLLWLGRLVPRKRLDLFLDGLALAVTQGIDVTATVVGRSTFVPNYERLVAEFPHPGRVRHVPRIPRAEVPPLMSEHDVLGQPSDEEDFGSSVAEAQACGMPAIVGATNGTGDYVCPRSIRLVDDGPEGFAAALGSLAELKRAGGLEDPRPSRDVALRTYNPAVVATGLEEVLRLAAREGRDG